MDFRAEELKYANPDRLDSYVKHTACPLDYFIEKEKVKLYSLLGVLIMIKEQPNRFAEQ